VSFDEDVDAGGPPTPVRKLREQIADADAILVVTPEYNGSIPGVLKNAIDWASRPRSEAALRGKTVAVAGASTGQYGAIWAIQDLRRVLGIAGARVIEGEVSVARAHELVDGAGTLSSEAVRIRLHDLLTSLGATRILRRQDIDLGKRPLEAAQWGGAVDNVGGDILTWLTRTTDNWGNIASIGLAASHKLETTVMPFILRGVSLLGINSSAMPREVRVGIWKRLATDLKPRHLDKVVTHTIRFDDLPKAFDDYVKNRIMGRTVVQIS